MVIVHNEFQKLNGEVGSLIRSIPIKTFDIPIEIEPYTYRINNEEVYTYTTDPITELYLEIPSICTVINDTTLYPSKPLLLTDSSSIRIEYRPSKLEGFFIRVKSPVINASVPIEQGRIRIPDILNKPFYIEVSLRTVGKLDIFNYDENFPYIRHVIHPISKQPIHRAGLYQSFYILNDQCRLVEFNRAEKLRKVEVSMGRIFIYGY